MVLFKHILMMACFISFISSATVLDISHIISAERFSTYENVADFIDDAPKVTITVQPEKEDIEEYGKGVVKTLTGSDCDRDGRMDDNATCNAVYLKLWLKYKK
jgi:hypothetical protein